MKECSGASFDVYAAEEKKILSDKYVEDIGQICGRPEIY
jgi:hypothetical protein